MNGLLYGVGVNYCGYATHKCKYGKDSLGKKIRISDWRCPYYKKWSAMLSRCYSKKMLSHDPTYSGCYVDDSWLSFAGFIKWVDSQPRKDWEELELDKDILFKGNKIYGPKTCVFISKALNSFLVNRNTGGNLTGSFYMIKTNKFRANCRNPFNGKREHLGFFDSEIEAHEAWRDRKRFHAIEFSKLQRDDRVSEALMSRCF